MKLLRSNFPGVRLRRQHWCCLSLIVVAVVLCLAVGLPLGSQKDGAEVEPDDGGTIVVPGTPEARMASVHALFDEVPLVDG